MRFHALACDFDGTLARDGCVPPDTLAALERLLATGRKLILVTGRELEDLHAIFAKDALFDWVVAENGGVLYRPATRETKLLGTAPPPAFVQALHAGGVGPLSLGHVLVATWQPFATAVLEAIHDSGLELQVIFNKDAVMVLPAGVNKATGLTAALREMKLSPHQVVGIGDSENDHSFLRMCACAVAVANALPALKEQADLVTHGDHGAGVTELIDHLLDDDLKSLEGRLQRHQLLLGTRSNAEEVRIPPYGTSLLIAGPSGSGKSTLATSILERLSEQKYQFCIIDPEGDYDALEGSITIGGSQRGPTVDEALQLLDKPETNLVINLVGLPIADRPSFVLALLPRVQELRARTGRPHWLVVDEAHHVLPAAWEPGTLALPQEMDRTLFLTVHPDQVAPAALSAVDTVLAVGQSPGETISQFCRALDIRAPRGVPAEVAAAEVLLWRRHSEEAPFSFRAVPCRMERRRHVRKYAEGELPPDRSFYFQGPHGRLNLRAQNLTIFVQIAAGVDDTTWMHHLRRKDYSRWFRERIKDEILANESEVIETSTSVSPAESRALIKALIEKHYTLPTTTPFPMPGTDAAGDKP